MRNSILTSVMTALVLTGCSSPPTKQPEKDRLTTGQVQLTLRANQTTQTEVLEAFGAPNLVSTNSQGEEVWTYQRNAIAVSTNVQDIYAPAYAHVFSYKGHAEQSNRTMTLIIKFKEIDGQKRVSSFNSRSSSF